MARFQPERYYPNTIRPQYNERGPSVYGDPDRNTLTLLKNISGVILEVGSGDGRYTHPILEKGVTIVAGDMDSAALQSLEKKTPAKYKARLETIVFDAFDTYPFDDERFDGVVSTAFLYLFPEDYIRYVVEESHRVLKPGGELVIDFLTDRKRIGTNGKDIKGEHEVMYTREAGLQAVNNLSKDLFTRGTRMESEINQDLRESLGYTIIGRKISVRAKKA